MVQKISRKVAWAIFISVALLACFWIVEGSESYLFCLDNGAGQTEARFKSLAMVEFPSDLDLQCFGVFLDENWTALLGLSILFLALTTGTLWTAHVRLGTALGALIKNAEAAHQREARAYISCALEGLARIDAGHFVRMNVRIRNSGTTPATDVRYRTQITAMSALIPPDAGGLPLPETFSSSFVLFPGSEFTCATTTSAALDETAIAALSDGTARLYVRGEIFYTDVFGNGRSTMCCYVLGTDKGAAEAFVAHGGPQEFRVVFEPAPFGNMAT